MTTTYKDFLGLELHPRQQKPRDRGICMVIDIGYNLAMVESVLELYGHLFYIAKLTELRDLGMHQFAVYLMHDAPDATLEAYGADVIPAFAGR